jgi:class 3 adenylate cyclase
VPAFPGAVGFGWLATGGGTRVRIVDLAAALEILVCEDVRRVTDGLSSPRFDGEPTLPLKGISREQRIWCVDWH